MEKPASKVCKLLGDDNAEHGKVASVGTVGGSEGANQTQAAGATEAATKDLLQLVSMMSQLQITRESLDLDNELHDIMGRRIAEKEALVSELQEQTTVCLSDMMAGLCSKLPYSDSTKQKLVDHFCQYAGHLTAERFIELVSELPSNLDAFLQWLQLRSHHSTLHSILTGILEGSTKTTTCHHERQLNAPTPGSEVEEKPSGSALPVSAANEEDDNVGDFLGMKNILPPSDSKDAVLATDVGSGIKQAVVPVEVEGEKSGEEAAAAAPSSGHGGGSPAAAACMAEESPRTPSPQPAEESEFSELTPRELKFPSSPSHGKEDSFGQVEKLEKDGEGTSDIDAQEQEEVSGGGGGDNSTAAMLPSGNGSGSSTPAASVEDHTLPQLFPDAPTVSGGGGGDNSAAAMPPSGNGSGSPTLAASMEDKGLPQLSPDAPTEGERSEVEPVAAKAEEKVTAAALPSATARAFTDVAASIGGLIVPAPFRDTVKGFMEENISTLEETHKPQSALKVADCKKTSLVDSLTSVPDFKDGDIGGASKIEEKVAQVDKGKDPATAPSNAGAHDVDLDNLEDLEELEEGSHDNILFTASQEKAYREMLGLSETEAAASHAPGEEEVSSRPTSPQKPWTRSAARKQRQAEQAGHSGQEQGKDICGNQGLITADARVLTRPMRATSSQLMVQVSGTATPGEAEAAHEPKEQGGGKPPKPPATLPAHTTNTPAMRALAISSSSKDKEDRKTTTIQGVSKKTPGEDSTQAKKQEIAAHADRAGGSSSTAKDAGLSQQGKIRISISGFSGALKSAQYQAGINYQGRTAAAEASTQLGFVVDDVQLASLNTAFGIIMKTGPMDGGYQRYSLTARDKSGSKVHLVSLAPRTNFIEVDAPCNAALEKLLKCVSAFSRKKSDTYEEVEAFFSFIGLDLLME